MMMIGLDLGKRKSQIAALDSTGSVVEEARISTSKTALAQWFGTRAECRVLVEASTSAEWVARFLESLGCSVVVADPRFGPMYARRDKKLKTDKRDARALADALRLGAYREATRRSVETRQIRARLLARDVLVRSRTRLISQVRSLCEREGSVLPRCDADVFLANLDKVAVDDWLVDVITPILREIGALTDAIEQATAVLDKMVRDDPVLSRFDEVRGVGSVVALAVKSSIGDPARFESAKQVTSYLGLVPSENSSGEKRHLGPITRSGDPFVRSMLIQAAWSTLRKTAPDSDLKRWATAIAERRGKRKTKGSNRACAQARADFMGDVA